MFKYYYYIAYLTNTGHGHSCITRKKKLTTYSQMEELVKDIEDMNGPDIKINIINIIRLKGV